MTGRNIICIGLLVVVLVFIFWGMNFLKNFTGEMTNILDSCIKKIADDNDEVAQKEFKKFMRLYNKKKVMISIFVNDVHLQEIEILSAKILEIFNEDMNDSIIKELEELSENISNIYSSHKINIENIL